MARSARPASARTAGAAIALLFLSNVATNRVLPRAAYVPWNLGMAAGMLGLARAAGLGPGDLGADAAGLGRGLRVGGAGAGAVAACYGLLLATEAGAEAFHDERVSSAGVGRAAWDVLVRIPVGTVLAEEIAFRGVLPALLTSSRRPVWVPGLVASVLFGLWHALPSRAMAQANRGMRQLAGRDRLAPAGLSVAAMALAGGVLHGMRQRSGHLAAPIAVHLATNVLGFLGARIVSRGR